MREIFASRDDCAPTSVEAVTTSASSTSVACHAAVNTTVCQPVAPSGTTEA